MNFLATEGRRDRLIPQHLADQIEPSAIACQMRHAVDSGRPQGADRPTVAKSVAVDEFLQGRLVRTIMALWPKRMGFVKRTILENDIMNGTC